MNFDDRASNFNTLGGVVMQNSRSPRNTRKVGRNFSMPSHNIGHGRMCRRSAPHGEKKEKSTATFFNTVTSTASL